jgi:hypothetical protein
MEKGETAWRISLSLVIDIERIASEESDSSEGVDSSDKSVGSSAVDEAANFLRQVLAGGPILANEVKGAASAAGISLASIQRAKASLGVKSKKTFTGHWVWQLP